jgi:hypothetical protein
MGWIARIVIALVIGIIVWLICTYLLGPILVSLVFKPAVIIGHFFELWGYLLGILAFLYYLFFGYSRWNPLPK